MTVTDTWKQLKKKNKGYSSITVFSNIMPRKMLEYVKIFSHPVESDIDTVTATITCDDISSLSQDKVLRYHTKIF